MFNMKRNSFLHGLANFVFKQPYFETGNLKYWQEEIKNTSNLVAFFGLVKMVLMIEKSLSEIGQGQHVNLQKYFEL